MAIKVSECGRRAEAALRAEGYNETNHSGPSEASFYVGGQKANHSAIIVCDASPIGKTWINIMVGSTSADPNVPGVQRQRLQARMDLPSSAAAAPTPGGGGGTSAVAIQIAWNGGYAFVR